jgi:hypothetical protein
MPTYTLDSARRNAAPVNARITRPLPANARPVPPRPPASVRPVLKVAPPARNSAKSADATPDKILFQSYFKSVGPRTYASQVKLLKNENHMLVLTVGKPNPEGGEPIKTRFIVFAEDFAAFFRLLQERAHFIKANPLPDKVRLRRQKFWEKQGNPAAAAAGLKR